MTWGQKNPIVEGAEVGNTYIDIRGLGALYGGSQGLAKALLDAVANIFDPRSGIACSKFPAYMPASTTHSLQRGFSPLNSPRDSYPSLLLLCSLLVVYLLYLRKNHDFTTYS